jgi:hypothetical protein
MKLYDKILAAVYDSGEIAQGHEDYAIGSMNSVMLTIGTTSCLKKDFQEGRLTIVEVKVVPFK